MYCRVVVELYNLIKKLKFGDGLREVNKFACDAGLQGVSEETAISCIIFIPLLQPSTSCEHKWLITSDMARL
jgi:hypothetical protein